MKIVVSMKIMSESKVHNKIKKCMHDGNILPECPIGIVNGYIENYKKCDDIEAVYFDDISKTSCEECYKYYKKMQLKKERETLRILIMVMQDLVKQVIIDVEQPDDSIITMDSEEFLYGNKKIFTRGLKLEKKRKIN
jgi:hypothetical protein